ncbi:hypothetical protein OQZ33_05445 [Pedobacter sp. MC2016-05]|uniref:hypothetical protein n=1 Tax=Pedobacter sp. MC2016-05 TaxID=2994474 RepID=UPI002246E616|nr:hypothetical protein [Pedobacter sp. MC2016-05]MCX2473767.1 hypothetical protein [Pedobacter sp. MC2016-05]
MGGKPIAEWRTADYNSLSSQLARQTKVYISENTLKRIFGRLKTPKRYFPHKATRDALAQFIGYRDWQEYELIFTVSNTDKIEVQVPPPNATPPEEPVQEEIPEAPKFRIRSLIVVLLAIFVISVSLIYIFRENYVDPDHVSLICENPFGEVPHTAVFKLSANSPLDENEKFGLDFMDEAAATTISGKREVTQFFRNPGVVYVKLLYKGKPIDTATVYLQTKGWVANSGNDSLRAFPIAGLRTLSKENLFVSANQLDSAGLDLSKPFLVGFSNIHSSKISGENFEFTCNLQAEASRPGVQCIESTIIILGEKGRHLVTMYKPSCAAFSEYNFSELKVNGSSKYLGNMGYDFKDGGEVRLRVRNKHVELYIAGKKVLSTSYKNEIGRVMGVKVVFNGIGRVRSPELEDLRTKEIY